MYENKKKLIPSPSDYVFLTKTGYIRNDSVIEKVISDIGRSFFLRERSYL